MWILSKPNKGKWIEKKARSMTKETKDQQSKAISFRVMRENAWWKLKDFVTLSINIFLFFHNKKITILTVLYIALLKMKNNPGGSSINDVAHSWIIIYPSIPRPNAFLVLRHQCFHHKILDTPSLHRSWRHLWTPLNLSHLSFSINHLILLTLPGATFPST